MPPNRTKFQLEVSYAHVENVQSRKFRKLKKDIRERGEGDLQASMYIVEYFKQKGLITSRRLSLIKKACQMSLRVRRLMTYDSGGSREDGKEGSISSKGGGGHLKFD